MKMFEVGLELHFRKALHILFFFFFLVELLFKFLWLIIVAHGTRPTL